MTAVADLEVVRRPGRRWVWAAACLLVAALALLVVPVVCRHLFDGGDMVSDTQIPGEAGAEKVSDGGQVVTLLWITGVASALSALGALLSGLAALITARSGRRRSAEPVRRKRRPKQR